MESSAHKKTKAWYEEELLRKKARALQMKNNAPPANAATTSSTHHRRNKSMPSGAGIVGLVLLLLAISCALPSFATAATTTTTRSTIHVYAALPSNDDGADEQDAAVARKQQHDLSRLAAPAGASTPPMVARVELHYLTHPEQLAFLQEHCSNAVVSLWNAWESADHLRHLQTELYKWCALSSTNGNNDRNDNDDILKVWIDSQSPILALSELQKLWKTAENVAVVDQQKSACSSRGEPMVHGSYLQIAGNANSVPRRMLEMLMQPEIQQMLPTHALLIPRQTYKWISSSHGGDDLDNSSSSWTFLNLSCRNRNAKTDKHLECAKGYCCSIQNESATLLMSRHLVLPHQKLPSLHQLPGPLNAVERSPDDPFVSTIQVQPLGAASEVVPTFYDILREQHALPSDEPCSKCLREKKGADCHTTCAKPCAAYCKHLCRTAVPAPHVAAAWTVTLPHYARDPERLIPRIVHQTWFEALDAERYPNLSRMAQSFQKAGWEYRFWSDDDATAFLRVHFPPPVLEAYQALLPGAFKADLFRYCVLLITGGVYADVDIQLESVLDLSVPPDVGFMVPVDEVRTVFCCCWVWFDCIFPRLIFFVGSRYFMNFICFHHYCSAW